MGKKPCRWGASGSECKSLTRSNHHIISAQEHLSKGSKLFFHSCLSYIRMYVYSTVLWYWWKQNAVSKEKFSTSFKITPRKSLTSLVLPGQGHALQSFHIHLCCDSSWQSPATDQFNCTVCLVMSRISINISLHWL